ncbi:hypothetical protein CLAFUW4_07627 [Fulvia fulva]|uniref:Putative effector 29 n=1 Tax=Passalora fulva TaxID=5499 RepID=A0A1P8YXJ7_PASFU|nr:uncharacterized protein CLAFUR5_14669 [Fulvia fulva]AQA29232.1 putative effector 29 [Fulvia fulva]KAK4622930.1 hypothetical protein CLAFUR0_07632 [Fulvia fulva]UJO19199.1 hypothetical protein CLAFUR5_14669 [Fulvia fulva]WPV15841.1 hypothetical protein CLAFUW4_07627 [Fulvia fulva]WPV31204.1 hypothetical protein CLAFUW7_07628 [Fulvia fulva]
MHFLSAVIAILTATIGIVTAAGGGFCEDCGTACFDKNPGNTAGYCSCLSKSCGSCGALPSPLC